MNPNKIIITIIAALIIATTVLGETITSVVSTKSNDLVIGQKTAGSAIYSQISLAGADRLTSDQGSPQLPVRIIRFALPYNAVIKGVSARTRGSEIISLRQPPAPAQPPVPLNGGAAPAWIAPSDAAYKGSFLFPSETAVITRVSALSEYKIVEISVHPVRYDPANGRLLLAEDITVSLEYAIDHGKQIAVRRRSALAQSAITNSVRLAVANKRSLASAVRIDGASSAKEQAVTDSPSANGRAVDFVIITSENLKESFQPLAVWRTRTGMVTEIRTVEWIDRNFAGADLQEKIRAFIQAGWSQWGTAFVMLGGAPSVVPVRYVPWTAWPGYIPDLRVPTDLYYSDIVDTCYGQDAHRYNFNYNRNDQYGELDGQADRVDLQPDVFLGRAPVETPAQAAAFVAKLLRYEQHPPAGFGSSFLMMADGWLASLAEMVNINPLTPAAPWIDPLEQYTPVSGGGYSGDETLNAASAVNRLNQGYNLVYHIDHGGVYSLGTAVGSGGGWLYRTEAQALYNAARPSIIVTPACSPNAFDSECFSKSLINNPNGGAVAFIGNTRVGFADQAWQCQAFFVALFQDRALRLGESFNRLIDGGWSEYHRLAMNLLGDPSMPLWTADPESLAVAHNAGQAGFVKQVGVAVSAQSAGDTAVVCLHKDGEIHATVQMVLPGTASFSIEPQSSGYLHVTVTGRNLRPYHDSCLVAPSFVPPARIASILCLDDSTGRYAAGSGNHDFIANPGEAIVLCPVIAIGPESSLEQLTVTLSAPDTALAVVNGTAKFSRLLPGSTVPCDSLGGNGFLVKISPYARPGDARLTFSFSSISSQGGLRSWTQDCGMPILADSLVYQTHRVEVLKYDHHQIELMTEAALSGFDRIIVLDSLTVSNLGFGASGNVSLRLRSDDPAVVLFDSAAILGIIRSQGRAIGQTPLGFLVREGRALNSVSINLEIRGQNGRASTQPLALVDSLPAPVNVVARTAAGAVRVSWGVPSNATYKGFQVYRTTLGQNDFQIINRSLIEGSAAYVDGAVSPNNDYVYAVTGVDSSGNQSGLSAARDTARAPSGLKPGFPVQMGTGGRGNRMWGSPAVGDIDGDGFSEIVMGCDDGKVYAVDCNGNDLPGWPVTIGYQMDNSTPVLADIDQDGCLEVILGNGAWYTAGGDGKVHAFNSDGSEAPGWPQTVAGDAFASCAAADVNGDGTIEVIAATTAGFVYVWTGDGTVLPGWPVNTGGRIAASPAIGNVDSDPALEIIVNTNVSGILRLFVLKANGQTISGWPRDLQAGASYTLSAPGLADLDNDGELEIVQAGEPEPAYGMSRVFCFNLDGTQPQGWPAYVASYARILASPAFGDLDGDGSTDVVICSGDGKVHAFSGQGMNGKLWETAATANGRTNPVIADIDGDHSPEVILTSEDGWLRALNGAGGSVVDGFPLWTESSWSAPAIADIDGDGALDLVASGWSSHKLFAWSLGAADDGSPSWSTYQGNSGRTGCYRAEIAPARSAVQSSPGAAITAPLTALLQNHPNPVSSQTTIEYQLAAAGRISIMVYNVTGQLVATLFNGLQKPGRHELKWRRTDDRGYQVASGTYLYRLESYGRSDVKRMVVVK